MTIQALAKLTCSTVTTGEAGSSRNIISGCVCDLLSHVLTNGKKDTVWITVQPHMNVVAVASLRGIGCILVCENISVPEAVIQKAAEENIALLISPLNAYEICGRLYTEGLRTTTPCDN